jgi:hypothetical protein
MTRHRAFKRLVRSRMAKTGESYTAARATLLAAEEPKATEAPALATSEAEIRRRTGHGWEEWFDLLDEWGAAERPHTEIARWVAAELDVEPLAWNAQAVAISYERARGVRAVGERAGGFAITAHKTVAVAAERLFDASWMKPVGLAGSPTESFASAPRRSRGRRASTGAGARPGSTSPSRRRARRRAPWRWSTSASAMPSRPRR